MAYGYSLRRFSACIFYIIKVIAVGIYYHLTKAFDDIIIRLAAPYNKIIRAKIIIGQIINTEAGIE